MAKELQSFGTHILGLKDMAGLLKPAAAKILIKSSGRKKLLGDSHWLLDVIVAPFFSNKALELLTKRKNRKIFSNTNLQNNSLRLSKWSYRHVRGGFIKQPHSDYILSKKNISLNTKSLTNHVFNDMLIAWAASFTSFHGGNEVAIAKNGSLLTCAGGPSTVQAVSSAVQRINEMGHDTKNSVLIFFSVVFTSIYLGVPFDSYDSIS